MESSILDKISRYYPHILLALCCLLFPLAIGSASLFDWDEVNFAEAAREMIVTKNYLNVQINFLPFWEKPPLFFWIQSMSMHIFGVNAFAARFPNAVVGVISIMSIYTIGKKWLSPNFGFLWALAYMGSILPHFYFKSGIIDPLFNLFIFGALYQFFQYLQAYRFRFVLSTAALAGLAVLTKGPVAVLIIALVLFFFLWYKWRSLKFIAWHWLVAMGVIGLLTSVWFAAEIIQGGGWALFQQFFDYQVRLFTSSEAGHGQPFYYHFIVLFIGCFPISLIAFPYILKRNFPDAEAKVKDLYTLQFILFWVVLILFSLTTTKILHYSSLCYFPLSFIAAYIADRNMAKNQRISTLSLVLLYLVGSVLALAFTALPLVIQYKDAVIPFIQDRFAVQNILVPVTWGGWEFLVGASYFCLMIFILVKLRKKATYIVHLFLLNAIMLNALMIGIVPKLEQHLQGSLISFFKAHQSPQEYVTTFGFKSYAQYFYTNKQPPKNKQALDDQWLITGPIDKPVYIVSKIFQREEVLRHPDIKLLYEEGGFVFYERKPK